MIIIKMGKKLEPANTFKLKCEHCGCVFTFDIDEVIIQEKRPMGSASIECPCCDIIIDFKPMDCVIRRKKV